MDWYDIPGWEGLYQISRNGMVKSLPRRVAQNRWGQNGTRLLSERILKFGTDGKRGYHTVILCRDGLRKTYKVHNLMAATFLGPRPFIGAQVRHYDDIATNDTVENLLWGTAADNQKDAVRNRRNANTKKTHCKKKHKLDGDNLDRYALEKRGQRICKTCRNENRRKKL